MKTDKKNMNKAFSLIELLMVMIISSILIIVSLPAFTSKMVANNPDIKVLKCVKKELAGNLNSSACTGAINDCLYGVNNACSSISSLIENGRANEKIAARKVMAAACDKGGDDACAYMVTSCAKDSAACNTGSGNDLSKYLKLAISTTSKSRIPIIKYASSYFIADNPNILNEVNADCCSSSSVNIACSINATNACSWQTSINNYINNDSQGEAITIDNSGNIYVAGFSYNGTNNDAAVIKFDSYGNMIWKRLLDSGANDEARGVAVDTAGNVYLAIVKTLTVDSNYETYLLRLDRNGNIDSSFNYKVYDSTSTIDRFNALTIDRSGNILVTGQTGNKVTAIKFNSSGSITWQRALYTNGSINIGWAIATDSTNDIYIAGSTANGTETFPLIIKLDSSGTGGADDGMLWYKIFTLASGSLAQGIAIDKNNNIYITGYLTNANKNTFVMKLNSDGAVSWMNILTSSANDEGRGVAVDRQGNSYITGYAGNNLTVIKLNTDGDKLWERSISPISSSNLGAAIVVDRSEHIYITGNNSSNIPVIKMKRTQTNGSNIFTPAFMPPSPKSAALFVDNGTFSKTNSTFIIDNFDSYATNPGFVFN